jgi:hypothetical protein
MIAVGDRITIVDTGNEYYKPYLNKVWTVESVSHSKNDHPGYDKCVGGPLIDCKDLPFSLYEFEFEVK